MKRLFSSLVILLLSILSVTLPAAADATVELSVSKTTVNIDGENILSISFKVTDYAIDWSQIKCGSYLEFGNTPEGTGQNPYVLVEGRGYSLGSWSHDRRYKYVDKKDFPWISKPTEPITTSIYFSFEVATPAKTFATPGSCEFEATVRTLDGKTTNLKTGVKLDFYAGTAESRFSGGDVVGKYVLTKENSPYHLTSPVKLGLHSEFVVQPGVEIFVDHEGPVFIGGGTGGIKLLGTTGNRISIHNARTLWSQAGSSTLEISFVKFDNIGAIFEKSPNLNVRAFGVYISDSVFLGRDNFIDGGFNVSTQIVLERNYFEKLPAFEFGLWGSGSTKKIVSGNWFEGNSSDKGYWLGGEAFSLFEGNAFSNFNSIVVQKQFPVKPRNNAAVPLNWLTMKSSYFKGLTEAQSGEIAEKDSVNGPNFNSQGFKFENILSAPSIRNYSLDPWVNTASPPSVPNSPSTSLQKLAVKQKNLTAFKGAETGLTAIQRSQIKETVESNPDATKFICTGISYESDPASVNIMVRARAKAACVYAKSLNPNLSTWVQSKPTKAKSYAGKVLLTVKTPSN